MEKQVAGLFGLQSPETGRVERDGSHATLIADCSRPLDSAAITIAKLFGVPVNSEDPPYVYKDDVKDVTADASRRLHPTERALIPNGGRLEVQFALRPDGSPEDIRGLLQELIDTANGQFPVGYRLEVDSDSFSLVPTHTRSVGTRGLDHPFTEKHAVAAASVINIR